MIRFIAVLVLIGSSLAQSGVPILGSTFKGAGGGGGTPVVTLKTSTSPCFGSNATGVTCTLDSSIASGNLVIIGLAYLDAGNGNPTSVTDNLGTTYTQFTQGCLAHGSFILWNCLYSGKPSGTVTTVTVSWPNVGARQYNVMVAQVTNMTSGAQDVGAAAASGGTTAYSSGPTATLAQSNEVAFGYACITNNITFTPTSYTNLATQWDGTSYTCNSAYFITSATTAQTYAGTLGTAGTAKTVVGTFKQ